MTVTGETRSFGSRKRERVELPPLPSDEVELRETLQFTQGVIALDVVFDRSGKPYVVEIQGSNAGLSGMEQLAADDPHISSEVREFFTKWNRGGIPNMNPGWMWGVETDKSDQLAFIPEANRPQSVVNKNFDHLFKQGSVILKPLNESQGYGIRIFTSEEHAEAQRYSEVLANHYGGFIAQAFIEPRGAELAPEPLKKRAASLRVVIPFTVVNGKPEITLHGVGYQRVAPFDMPDGPHPLEPRESGGVVNLARGASAVPMSASEYARVLPVATQILHALTAESDRSRSYRRELTKRLRERTMERRIALILSEEWHPSIDVAQNYNQSLEEARAEHTFVRYVEREIALLSEETKAQLSTKRVFAGLTHTGGGDGKLQVIQYRVLSDLNVTLSFNVNQPKALAHMLEMAAKGKMTNQESDRQRRGKSTFISTDDRLVIPIERSVVMAY